MIKSEYNRWVQGGGREQQFTFEDIDSESIVFDVGMWTGDWTNEISSRYNPFIFGFEPIDLFYKTAKERFKSNSKIKICNCGLGGENRKDIISVDRDSSSLFRKAPSTEHIIIRDIFELLITSDLEKIDLLALNCEGCEYEILQRLITTRIINKIKKLFIQFHFIREEDQMLRGNLIKELAKTHIQNYCYLSVWELWSKNE